MPRSVTDVGVERTEEMFSEYFERIKNSSAINAQDETECEKFRSVLRTFWNM